MLPQTLTRLHSFLTASRHFYQVKFGGEAYVAGVKWLET